MAKVYVGDIGTEIILDCGLNIAAATSVSMRVRNPSGATSTWTAVLEGTTQIKHVTVEGDLAVPGVYRIQAKVVMPDWSGTGSTAEFTVYREFD